MKVEELAIWLYESHRTHIIDGTVSCQEWEDIHEFYRERWRGFAKAHKQVFHAGDGADF